MTTKVLLLRHGETELNVGHRFRGRADPPLTATGERQARAAAVRQDLQRADVVCTSPRRRAVATATAILGPTRTLAVDDRLDDIDYGDWTGRTSAEVSSDDTARYETWMGEPDAVTFPNGEAVSAVVGRARAALDAFVTRHDGQAIVVVTHDIIIRIVLCDLLDAPLASIHRFDIGLTSVTALEWGDTFVIRTVNDTAHLRT